MICIECGATFVPPKVFSGAPEADHALTKLCGGERCLLGVLCDDTEAALRKLYMRGAELRSVPRFHMRERVWFVVLGHHSGMCAHDGTLLDAIGDLFARMEGGEDVRG